MAKNLKKRRKWKELISLRKIHQKEYNKNLKTFQFRKDIKPMIGFFLEMEFLLLFVRHIFMLMGLFEGDEINTIEDYITNMKLTWKDEKYYISWLYISPIVMLGIYPFLRLNRKTKYFTTILEFVMKKYRINFIFVVFLILNLLYFLSANFSLSLKQFEYGFNFEADLIHYEIFNYIVLYILTFEYMKIIMLDRISLKSHLKRGK